MFPLRHGQKSDRKRNLELFEDDRATVLPDYLQNSTHMTELLLSERKGLVLTRPSLPCLAPYHTINLTAGCPFSCRYCYAQSFRTYPGKGKVIFYANTLEALSFFPKWI